jgi:hypothetical protein
MYTRRDEVADILPGPPLAAGVWASNVRHPVNADGVLTRMPDGNVLNWQGDSTAWRLWAYDPTNANVLTGPVREGIWPVAGIAIVRMGDGRVLLWHPDTGQWQLFNYNSSSADVFTAYTSGSWSTIKSGPNENVFPPTYETHNLVTMPDGNLLDWGPMELGWWRLWKDDPAIIDKPSPLPAGPLVTEGVWKTILGGAGHKGPFHRLIPMVDGRILDWTPDDGSGNSGEYWLWDYDASQPPNHPSIWDIFPHYPDAPAAHGKWPSDRWSMSKGPDHLVAMEDGRVLAYNHLGEWSLWEYERKLIARPTLPPFNTWFAEADPLSRLISMSLYATLTKPRPQLSEIHDAVMHVLRTLDAGQRAEVAAQLGAFKQTLAAIEEAMKR